MLLECTGKSSDYEEDVKGSRGFRRSADHFKRDAFLDPKGCVLDGPKILKKVIEGYSKPAEHRPAWASPQNHLPACQTTPVLRDEAKFLQFLRYEVDLNQCDARSSLSLQDFLDSSIAHSTDNTVGLVNSLSNFDKVRVMAMNPLFQEISNSLIRRIASGDLMDKPPKTLHWAANEALSQYATDLMNPADVRFRNQPDGEAGQCWLDAIARFFSTEHLQYLQTNLDYLMSKRDQLIRDLSTTSSTAPNTATGLGPVAPKKRKRQPAAEADKICTTQALYELSKSGDGRKECTKPKCTGHYEMDKMTKNKAVETVKKYASESAYKKLLEAVKTFFP
jgi:hypothetical protein